MAVFDLLQLVHASPALVHGCILADAVFLLLASMLTLAATLSAYTADCAVLLMENYVQVGKQKYSVGQIVGLNLVGTASWMALCGVLVTAGYVLAVMSLYIALLTPYLVSNLGKFRVLSRHLPCIGSTMAVVQ